MVKNYDSGSIKNLQFPESIRAKPSLYVGSLGNDALFHLFKEVSENVVDEALGGHASECVIEFGEDQTITVFDNGRGIPFGKTKITDQLRGGHVLVPTLKAAVAFTHTSGKFNSESYEVSRGTHGLGVKCNNALSTRFEVWTCHKDNTEKWEYVGYAKGIEKAYKTGSSLNLPVNSVSGKKPSKGTVIRWTPDLDVLGASKISIANVSEWLTMASYFTKGLEFTAVLPNGKKKTFFSENGVADYLQARLVKVKTEPINPAKFVYQDPLVDCVFQMTAYDGCDMQSFTNGLNNPDKGNHFNALFVALSASLEKYVKRGQEFGVMELREGMVGLVNVKLSSPKFSSQTKEKLVDERAAKPLQDILLAAFTSFFAKNKAFAESMCERASSLRELKNKFSASKAVLNKLKHVSRMGFPAKAAISPNCKSEDRELFLLEGESAASLSRSALYAGFQELLPLKGKPMNSMKATEERVLLSQEIVYILAMIGFNPNAPDPLSKLRVSKIILMSDPDPDGHHINSLLLALFYKYLPQLIDRLMVYVAETPEYFAETKAGYVFGDTTQDMIKKITAIGQPNARINHVKGYGEFELAPLRSLVFEPATRRLIQLQPLTSKDRKVFDAVMGESVEGRKLLLGI